MFSCRRRRLSAGWALTMPGGPGTRDGARGGRAGSATVGETLAAFVGGGIGGGATTDAEGRFRIAGIRPGRYILSARDNTGMTGELPLETAGADVNGLQIVTGPGAKIAGRLVGETGAPL